MTPAPDFWTGVPWRDIGTAAGALVIAVLVGARAWLKGPDAAPSAPPAHSLSPDMRALLPPLNEIAAQTKRQADAATEAGDSLEKILLALTLRPPRGP